MSIAWALVPALLSHGAAGAALAVARTLTKVVGWHFGQLHPYENALALLLAFGPFVVLAVVIVVRRREDDDEEDEVEASDR